MGSEWHLQSSLIPGNAKNFVEANAKSKQDDCKAVSTFLDKEWQAICIMHVAATELLTK